MSLLNTERYMAKDNKTPKQEAVEMIMLLEARYKGNLNAPNLIQAELAKQYERSEVQTPRNRVTEQRVIEIARAYAHVSDGKGGVIPRTERVSTRRDAAMERYDAAVSGFMADGKTPLTSQREALQHGLHDLMTPEMRERIGKIPKAHMDNVAIDHNAHDARKIQSANAAKPAAERVAVTVGGGHSRPSRGFATVAAMATTAALTTLAIPALRHLGIKPAADEPAIRMTSLNAASSGLNNETAAIHMPPMSLSEPAASEPMRTAEPAVRNSVVQALRTKPDGP